MTALANFDLSGLANGVSLRMQDRRTLRRKPRSEMDCLTQILWPRLRSNAYAESDDTVLSGICLNVRKRGTPCAKFQSCCAKARRETRKFNFSTTYHAQILNE